MPACLTAEQVLPGQLYFVHVPEFEGELRVGLGRAEAELSEDGTKRRVNWLQRRAWSNDPAQDGLTWPSTPNFEVVREANSRRTKHSYEPAKA
eukprot:5777672-Pleurochrysis_carterae.AAC.1